MELVSIFGSPDPKMASAHFEGDESDVFNQLLSDWNNREYLVTFFIENSSDLQNFWNLSIAQAVDTVIREAEDFENELFAIQNQHEEYEEFDMKQLFEEFHKGEFILRKKGSSFRKARPDFPKPMIRLYAVELQDGYIIAGGCIKLTRKLSSSILEKVQRQMQIVQDFVNANQIVSLTDI